MRISTAFAAVSAGAALLFGGAVVDPDGAGEVDAALGEPAKRSGLANFGLDPVSFLEHGRRTVGLTKYSAIHDGAIYRFANTSNLKKFRTRPGHYKRLPGGYCPYGVVVGAKFFGDPRCFKTADGGLSRNLDEEVQETPPERVRGAVRQHARNWTQITLKDPSDLG